ncbi:Elicitor-responsive protein 1 [Morella rubra]|uniref:Elicitor-responsive protein 1 n=1 Tax=Morella rubra TaxID=262757 RepID=A0A6A1W240_9ROSI|nr:Elicitor-responsive protein 1 [Morella rubra]
MRRYSPPYYSPPRRGYGSRGRSPPRRGHGGGGGGGGGGYGRRNKEQNHGSLLVRNIPLDCRPEELRVPFERFGLVRDVYIPKDYYSGEPRGFAFVQFVDSYEASEAQYHMNGQIFAGREISVVLAAETRKRPEEMRHRARVRSFVILYAEPLQALGEGGHRTMDVLGLVLYPVHDLRAILQILELDTAQGELANLQTAILSFTVVTCPGPTHLPQDEGVNIQFPQVEGMQIIHDHQEVPEESEMWIAAGLILLVMEMLLIKMKMAMAMDIARNQLTRLRKHEVSGGHRLVEFLDHPLDLGQGRMDPYVLIQYKTQERKSSVARGQGGSPVWNEKFSFRVEYPGKGDEYKLILKILDKDTFSADDFIGQATIYVKDLLVSGVEKGTAELHPRKYSVVRTDKTYCGEIQVGVTFTPKVEENDGGEEFGGWKHSHHY